jgi:hypothetical protein
VNAAFAEGQFENGGFEGFFEFGTPHAKYPVSPGWSGDAQKTPRSFIMFAINFADRFVAAAVSVVISASLLAYAIIPASPGIIA